MNPSPVVGATARETRVTGSVAGFTSLALFQDDRP